MSSRLRTHAIVLRRVDYGESDRIVTMLTDDAGKITLMAKGARNVRSKLAGGIELFSVSEIVYTPGRGNIGILLSARLQYHASSITSDVERTMFGYDLLKMVHTITEDVVEPGFFAVVQQAIMALGNTSIAVDYINTWVSAQLLTLTGHTPNLLSDINGAVLKIGTCYDFDFEHVAFRPGPDGEGAYGTDEIKFLRIIFGGSTLSATTRIAHASEFSTNIKPLVLSLRQYYLSI